MGRGQGTDFGATGLARRVATDTTGPATGVGAPALMATSAPGGAGGGPPAARPSAQGAGGPDDLRLPSGKAGFTQGQVPPPEALALADDMLLRLADRYSGGWARESAAFWDVETFSAKGAEDGAETEAGWEWLHDEHEAKSSDGVSAIFGDPDDGHFVCLTPAAQG